MTDVPYLIGWNLLVAALFGTAAWLLCRTRLLNRRPALCHGLWFLVLLKLVTPPLIPVPMVSGDVISITHYLEWPASRREPILSSDRQRFEFSSASNSLSDDSAIAAAHSAQSDVLAVTETASVAESASVTSRYPRRPSIFFMLLGLSLLVSAILWLLAVRQFVRIGRLFRQANSATERASTVLRELSPVFGNRPSPALVIVDHAIMPMLWAAPGHATIVLPRQAVDLLDQDQLRSIIGHELAHLTRRDGLTQLFAFFVTSLLWWNPFAWLARREMRAAAGSLLRRTRPGAAAEFTQDVRAQPVGDCRLRNNGAAAVISLSCCVWRISLAQEEDCNGRKQQREITNIEDGLDDIGLCCAPSVLVSNSRSRTATRIGAIDGEAGACEA